MDRKRITDPTYIYPYPCAKNTPSLVRLAVEAAWATIKFNAIYSNLYTARQVKFLKQLTISSGFMEVAQKILAVDASDKNPILISLAYMPELIPGYYAHTSKNYPSKTLKYMRRVRDKLLEVSRLIEGDLPHRVGVDKVINTYPKDLVSVQGAGVLSGITLTRSISPPRPKKEMTGSNLAKVESIYHFALEAGALALLINEHMSERGNTAAGNKEQIDSYLKRKVHEQFVISTQNRPDLSKKHITALKRLHNEATLFIVDAFQNGTMIKPTEEERGRLRVTTNRARKRVS